MPKHITGETFSIGVGGKALHLIINWALELPTETISNIALHGAGNAQRNLTYFPISFNPADYITKGAAYVC